MTAAGVQTNDSPAYVPPSPSTSVPDAKGTGATGKPAPDGSAPDAHGTPSDFRSELESQQAGPKQAESKASPKADPGKNTKKRGARTDDDNPSPVIPMPVADPQKPILPFSLALPQPQPQEPSPDQSAEPAGKTTPDSTAQVPSKPLAQVLSQSMASVAILPELQRPTSVKQFMKVRQSAQSEATPNQTAASNHSPAAEADPGKIPVAALAAVPSATQDLPVQQAGPKSEEAAQDPAVMITSPGDSSNAQPVSSAEVKLPAIPAEPGASAVQETRTSSPRSSTLAFAARVQASQPKFDQPVAASSSPTPVPSVSGSQTAVQIPVRYAATAQIIQSAVLGPQSGAQGGSKKDAGVFTDRSVDRSVRADSRIDTVLPQFETVSQSASSAAPGATQPAAPTARAESVMEPPAAQPTSSHDIRVRVPDNNGGSTQVRFVESGGEVRVSVRTADESLAQNLRTHLNDLTQRLSDGGMPAEIWKPASSAASSQNDFQQQSQQDGRGSGGQNSGGQGGQPDRQQKRPAWLDEMEASLQGEQG